VSDYRPRRTAGYRESGDDAALWAAYWAAPDPDRPKAAAAIVAHHAAGLRAVARDISFRGFTTEDREDLAQEVAAVALERVVSWDPAGGASFLTWVRRGCQELPWMVQGERCAIRVGRQTARLRSLVRGEGDRRGRALTPEEAQSYLATRGKRVGLAQASRLVAHREPAQLDAPGEDGGRRIDPADPAVDVEREALPTRAVELLDAAGLTPVQRRVVELRILADPPLTVAEVAEVIGVEELAELLPLGGPHEPSALRRACERVAEAEAGALARLREAAERLR
jgi:hypothetical protein